MFSALPAALIKLATSTPAPIDLNAENVDPGPVLGYVFGLLTIALVILLFSLNRHVKRINFKEEEDTK